MHIYSNPSPNFLDFKYKNYVIFSNTRIFLKIFVENFECLPFTLTKPKLCPPFT